MTLLLDALLAGEVTEMAPLRLGEGRLVVVVPHPDDEALATGGLIAHHSAAGDRIAVVAVTDGEGAFGERGGADLAAVRRREQERSLAELGVSTADVVRLELPDAAVGRHVPDLACTLAEFVDHRDVLVAPSPWDWHPDHEACGRAARAAAGRTGTPVLWSTFWAHHHPDRLLQQAAPLLRFTLSDDDLDRRTRAIACHESQFGATGREAVVAADQVAHLALPVEYYHR
jgi:LmbE family N-acetylglucosaminyl deacetylase